MVRCKNISENEYKHAQHIWTHFNIQSMGEYRGLYLRLDVLLSADVMNKFRQTCMGHYKLDPSHFLYTTKLVMECYVEMTNVIIELMRDIGMYTMISKNIRGALCTIGSIRYVKANNPYKKESYDPDDETSFI